MTPEKLKQSAEIKKEIDFLNEKIDASKKRLNPADPEGWDYRCSRIKFEFRNYDDYLTIGCENIQAGPEVFLILFNILINRLIIKSDELQKLFDSL